MAAVSRRRLCGVVLLATLASVASAAGTSVDAAVVDGLTAGYPEVAELLRQNPYILEFLAEPMWRDVALHAPLIPGTPWRIHDLRRPQPPVVSVPRDACSARTTAPSDAVVVFDGRSLDGFAGPDRQYWEVHAGELVASGRHASRLPTRQAFGDVQIHIEFATPDPPTGRWQFRGNSGVFLMGRYEVQILDSFENPTYPDGQAGALYGQVPPLANASLPPGVWQCLDIVFAAPRFSGSTIVEPARVTVLHNGVLIQDHSAFLGPTRFAEIGPYEPHAGTLPFALQDHGDPGSRVRFRNMWARPLSPAASAPQQ